MTEASSLPESTDPARTPGSFAGFCATTAPVPDNKSRAPIDRLTLLRQINLHECCTRLPKYWDITWSPPLRSSVVPGAKLRAGGRHTTGIRPNCKLNFEKQSGFTTSRLGQAARRAGQCV